MRYETIEAGVKDDKYYWIRDNEARKWNMPEKAVTLNFGNRARAEQLTERLNTEWAMFNCNPR